ncbi:MAG: hypothetical protein P9M06_05710 [Candidatus Saelkia tenebricola]|nr:hypothetical protein [Candidatus Saelkia tenebricola]
MKIKFYKNRRDKFDTGAWVCYKYNEVEVSIKQMFSLEKGGEE